MRATRTLKHNILVRKAVWLIQSFTKPETHCYVFYYLSIKRLKSVGFTCIFFLDLS